MRTVIIYTEQSVLNEISNYLEKYGADIIGVFSSSLEGYEFVITEKPDVVYINIELLSFNGFDIGVRIKRNCPRIMIIYFCPHPMVTAKPPVSHPTDYMLMPIDENMLAATIGFLKSNPRFHLQERLNTPRIICFGRFKVEMETGSIKFPTQKVREMLAFMLCHYDKPFFKGDMIKSLFQSGDDKKDSTNFRVTLFRLRHALEDAGVKKEHLLINENCSIAIAPGICDLIDYFEFIQRNKAINDRNIVSAQNIIDMIDSEPFSDIDTPWIADIREIHMAKIENLMLDTARHYISTGKNFENAENILTKLLDYNNLSENGYTLLLDMYISTFDKVKYIALFKRYARVMKTELNIVPDRKYTRHYVSLNR
jgi:two-component SAPR family response regulator